MAGKINAGILNNYSIRPKNLTQYTALRGVVDFSQLAQFDQFEKGYGFLSVIKIPRFLEVLSQQSKDVEIMVTSFVHMLEYEFRGLSGLPNITADFSTITDGANELRMINNVSRDTSIDISMEYFERRGSLITKFCEYYLTGIKDPMSKAKTYHGLIKNNLLEPGIENEVFTFMFYATDNTYLRLEKAWLLSDCQITGAELSMYDMEKGQISNQPITINFTAFPITGTQVDKAAQRLLQEITGTTVTQDTYGTPTYSHQERPENAALDSTDYLYGIMDEDSPSAIPKLTEAISGVNTVTPTPA